jgi:hypothetical protein
MTGPAKPPRYLACQWCGEPMPSGLRSHAMYCKRTCRVLASRARRRAATAGQSVNPGTLAGHPIPGRPAA